MPIFRKLISKLHRQRSGFDYFCSAGFAKMVSNHIKINSELKSIFRSGVEAVQAENVFRKENFSISDDASKINCVFNENQLTIDINNKQCHLVGFGKAVYGMANECSKMLGDRLRSGILNVPLKTMETFPDIKLPKTIQVFESAKNNLPDTNAERVALKIVEFIRALGDDDVLFILVSGGGSALLPLPSACVTLDQKQELIKKLASKGATIRDINRVRIDLSRTKGGKLSTFAKNIDSVTVFIVSDIVGDPIHLIASGPTVQHSYDREVSSTDILKRFDLSDSLPESVKEALVQNEFNQSPEEFHNIKNVIVANNEIAVNAIRKTLEKKNILGIILSTKIEGIVVDINDAYYKLGESIQLFMNETLNEHHFDERIESLKLVLSIRDSFFDEIKQIINQSRAEALDICVIGSGETTVEVNGDGMGGRNQELALRFSRTCFKNSFPENVWLLSAGTDGIDGPTTAAGAIGGTKIIKSFLASKGANLDDVDYCLQRNDSFNFYANLCDGDFHVLTGHTGTNVMDVHLLFIQHAK